MNRLSKEKSSYLKSASHQPINWFPWDDESFEKAKKENKPILLDIGASWCHWCHIIDKESYDDKDIGEIINKNFIAVKVDRDERPDIDRIYQEAASLISGQGGWPLTVFLTPEKIPFYAGTYFPPEDRFGLPSFRKVLLHVSKVYQENKAQINHTTSQILKHVSNRKEFYSGEFNLKIFDEAVVQILNLTDTINGGFGSSPKFPNTEAILFLLTIYAENGDKDIIDAVKFTLRKMAEGGFYDQIGGGFHRYSVDEEWKVPHFEKLLIDNAFLLRAYLSAYNLTGDSFFKRIAEGIIDFAEDELLDEKGFFYGSVDADSEGEEGMFFTWTKEEIEKVLEPEEARIVSLYYGVDAIGETGSEARVHDRNVLFVRNSAEEVAEVLGKSSAEARKIIGSAKKKILSARGKRERPFVDKIFYTNWNCAMAGSLFEAYKILGKEKYLKMGLRAVDFILENVCTKKMVYHMFSGGAEVEGFLDDYQFLIEALVEAFECTFERNYLDLAVELMESSIKNFWDDRRDSGGFFYAHETSKLLKNEKPYLDYSAPSGNSVAAVNLIKLGEITGNSDFLKRAEKILKMFSGVSEGFFYRCSYLTALNLFLKGAVSVKVVEGKDFEKFVREIYKLRNPRKIVTAYRKGSKLPNGLKAVGGKTTAYVCSKGKCSEPIFNAKNL